MQENEESEKREEMLSKEGGFHSTKAVQYLLEAVEYYHNNAGLERGTFLFLKETIEAAIGPYLYIYSQGMKRGLEIGRKECFLTIEEYRGLMGFGEEEEKGEER